TLIRPGKDYGMRVWLDPDKLRARSLTTVDVLNSLREQNVQVAAGVIGQPPSPPGQGNQYTLTTIGRLDTPEQFENVILNVDGKSMVRLKDVARVELGARAYDTLARFDGVPSGMMVVYQSPGANTVTVAREVRNLLNDLSRDLPPGLEFSTVYDTSGFVGAAMSGVLRNILLGTALVVLVVFLFLGSLRTTLIPIVVIPVSLIGTLIAIRVFGFGLNLPTLFGLVLAIGLVVDDAVVIVENVLRHIEEGIPAWEAASRAMREVFAPILGVAFVLMAVFLPTALLPGISGQIYRQFALTIAATTIISTLCTLTLNQALAGSLLCVYEHGRRRPILKRAFDRVFTALADGYARVVRFL